MSHQEHRLVVAFLSADRHDRAVQIRYELGRLRDDLLIRVLLNPEDAKGQHVPSEAHGKHRTWDADPAVPAGEFHLAVSRVQ